MLEEEDVQELDLTIPVGAQLGAGDNLNEPKISRVLIFPVEGGL